MLSKLFTPFGEKKKAYALYTKLVEQARQPVFYSELGVEDSIDGRFDMIILHLFLIERRLAKEADKTAKLRQILQEAMVSDMDRSLRELGVGDMGIGKQVKRMGVAWFGRLKAYASALEADNADEALAAALSKNLYRLEEGALAPHSAAMAAYVVDSVEKLAGYDAKEVIDLQFEFAAPKS